MSFYSSRVDVAAIGEPRRSISGVPPSRGREVATAKIVAKLRDMKSSDLHRSAAGALGLAVVLGGCAGFPGVGAHTASDTVPPDVEARRFGRWICGSELPQGRPSSVFELVRRLGPGKAWSLDVDADGLAALQVVAKQGVGKKGRARQGCWTELSTAELASLERTTRESGLCDRAEDLRSVEPHNAFDLDARFAAATCTKHFGATALLRAPAGQRFAEDTRRLMDQVAGGTGAFRRMEDVVIAMVPAQEKARARAPLPANVAASAERLECGKEHQTIYQPGDAWLLQYSFQKGLLWRRELEVSSRGVLALEFASLQNEARYACTGQLTEAELKDLREVVASSRPCDIKGPEPRGRDDHAYVSVNPDASAGVECRYHPVRYEDLRDSWSGRRFDGAMTSLLAQVAGPGGVDPFDPARGFLVEKKEAGPPAPARGVNPAGSKSAPRREEPRGIRIAR